MPRMVERPHQLVRHAGARQQLEYRGIVIHADELEAVDAPFDERTRGAELSCGVVLVRREQQRVPGGGKVVRQRLRRGGEDRVVDRRKHRADGARAPRRERSRGAMRHVAEHGGDLPHPLARAGLHEFGFGKRARSRGERYARGARHVAQLGVGPGRHRAPL
ncbi:MAG: hypothetical protein A2W69_05115 [Gammaproteobacteria bacterium RIFCSPLOWO2_02_47_7]|nr:MAG: hypothetical protein A2W69_05115 [Gammaproteobacteria bacterium RIFCSPLOWO2_02_47_7]